MSAQPESQPTQSKDLSRTPVPACPACDAGVALGADTICDELVECGDCGVELVVLSTDPMVLAEAPQTEEDWGQ